jgi:3-hydroxyacyl-CoA dehydrogenase
MMEEGVASANDIDAAMTLGYGFPVGPLRLTDLVGIDVRLGIARYLARELGPRFTPPQLMARRRARLRMRLPDRNPSREVRQPRRAARHPRCGRRGLAAAATGR